MNRFSLSRLSRLPLIAAAVSGCASQAPLAHPTAVAYTHPVPYNEVQDAAIWVHPTRPEASLFIVTNERRGLEVHSVDGTLTKHLDDGIRSKYVDVLYGFPLASGKADLVVVSCFGTEPQYPAGLRVYTVDPAKSKLANATAGPAVPTFASSHDQPLGLCTYRSPRTGKFYAFVTPDSSEGPHCEQYELTARGDNTVTGTLVRSIPLPGKSKGGVADAGTGTLYLADEKQGIFAYDPEPDGPVAGKLVIPANDHGLVPHVRGPALVDGGNGQGYLLVLSQGAKITHPTLNVYDRRAPHAYRATIDPSEKSPLPGFPPDPLNHTSGMDVTAAPLGPMFPHGALLLNDQSTPHGDEDFKIYRWDEIARQAGLRLSTTHPSR